MPPCVILRLVIRHEAELSEWWAERVWVAVPWMFRSGVEIVFEDARFTAIACQQYGERLAGSTPCLTQSLWSALGYTRGGALAQGMGPGAEGRGCEKEGR